MKIESFPDGFLLCADSTSEETANVVKGLLGENKFSLINADPPYGNVLKIKWDKVGTDDVKYAQEMVQWTQLWAKQLHQDAAFYVWGGIGAPGFRPFFRYLTLAENASFQLANLITWGKKRAYGVKHNYLFTREECAYFVNGLDVKKPRLFNIPLLDTKRGYAGFNKDYPAKSEFYRRTNVWTDITEIMQGKDHAAQKPQRVIEITIETHTKPNEWVLDPFGGAGTTAYAARKLGRKFVVIEADENGFEKIKTKLASATL